MTRQTHFWCVIPAAGIGTRMGGEIPKQYLPLAGACVLSRTLQRVLAHPRIAGVVLAHAPGDARAGLIAQDAQAAFNKSVRTCMGGDTRADSVLAGLQKMPDDVQDDAHVLVHDAARPCLTHRALDDLFAALDGGVAGAILATRVFDSVKRADPHSNIAASVPRESIWRAQTPQAFRLGALRQALLDQLDKSTQRDPITDESSAMERIGVFAQLVEGGIDNLKITTPDDLALAEWIWQRQQQQGETA